LNYKNEKNLATKEEKKNEKTRFFKTHVFTRGKKSNQKKNPERKKKINGLKSL